MAGFGEDVWVFTAQVKENGPISLRLGRELMVVCCAGLEGRWSRPGGVKVVVAWWSCALSGRLWR